MRYGLPQALAALRPGEVWFLTGHEDLSGLNWHHDTDPPTEGEVLAKLKELQDNEPKRLLRIERDKRLAEVDWIVIRSMAHGVPIPQEYQDYMQALRDLPDNSEPKIQESNLMGDLDMSSVQWPTKP